MTDVAPYLCQDYAPQLTATRSGTNSRSTDYHRDSILQLYITEYDLIRTSLHYLILRMCDSLLALLMSCAECEEHAVSCYRQAFTNVHLKSNSGVQAHVSPCIAARASIPRSVALFRFRSDHQNDTHVELQA